MIVTDGFTGNIALKLMEGVSQTMLGAIREAAMSSPRASSAALLLRGALGGLRDGDRPGGQRRRLPARACAAWASCRTGASRARGFAQAILRAERGAREDIVAQTHARARAGRRAQALARVRVGR